MSQTTWEINQDHELGWHAVAPKEGLAVTVVDGGSIFTRNAIHVNVLSNKETRENVLVAVLDGVRVYVTPGSVLVTKRDLNL